MSIAENEARIISRYEKENPPGAFNMLSDAV